MKKENKDIFKQFIKSMNTVLIDNMDNDSRDQKKLLEDLFDLENGFRDLLISIPEGKQMYYKFADFIKHEKRNILSARVYFRERQAVFSSKISPCFKENRPWNLYNFHINYHFVKWVCARYTGPKKKKLSNMFDKIIEVRKILCENNIPLAINRAKIFWSKVPASHLEYMDLIQDANEGLLTAIDKFVPPYKAVFRSVAVGRMTLNMHTDHNDTVLKLSPTEKRILYRANNARVKEKLKNEEEILEYVKESFGKVTIDKLRAINKAATGVISINAGESDEDGEVANITIPSLNPNPEDVFLSKELRCKINNALSNIPIIEMKLIKMKFGVRSE